MKVAVLTPVYGDVKAKFAESIANLIATTMAASVSSEGTAVKFEIRTFVEQGLLPINRNILAVKALEWKADYLLWADADMYFPADALLRLLARNVEIVGVNYPRRDGASTSAPIETTETDARAGKLEGVEYLGLGLCLMKAGVVKRLFDQSTKEKLPLFHIELGGDGWYLGEDIFFFRRVRRLGIPVHLDHAVSWEIAHVTEQLLTNRRGHADTVLSPAGSG